MAALGIDLAPAPSSQHRPEIVEHSDDLVDIIPQHLTDLNAVGSSPNLGTDMHVHATIEDVSNFLALLDTGAVKNSYISEAYARRHCPDKIKDLPQRWKTSVGGLQSIIITQAAELDISLNYGGVRSGTHRITCHLLPQENNDADSPNLIIGLPQLRKTSFKDIFFKRFSDDGTTSTENEIFMALLALMDPIPGPHSQAPLPTEWPVHTNEGNVPPLAFAAGPHRPPAMEDDLLERHKGEDRRTGCPRVDEDRHEIEAFINLFETLKDYAIEMSLDMKDMDGSGADLDAMGNYLAPLMIEGVGKYILLRDHLPAHLNKITPKIPKEQPWWKQSDHVVKAIQRKAYEKRKAEFMEKIPLSLGNMIPEDKREEWIELIKENMSCFVNLHLRISNTEPQSFVFKPGCPETWRSRVRSIPLNKEQFVENTIKYYAETHQWVRGEAHFLHSFVAVMKPNTQETGLLRLAIDFKECLNKWLQPISQFVKNVPEVVGSMKDCKVAIYMDLEKAFHQVRVTEESLRYCGVLTSMGNWVPTGLPEGITVASQLLARVVEIAYGKLRHLNVHALQDGIIIGAKNLEELKETLKVVFQRTNEVNLQFGLSKCGFGVNEFEFFGLDVVLPVDDRPAYTTIAQKNVETLMKLSAPTNLKEAMQTMGIAVFHSTHIPNFSEIVKPMQPMLKRNHEPTKEELAAAAESWEMVKAEVKKTHRLFTIDYSENAKFILRTDWSINGYGFVLLNGVPDKSGEIIYRPVVYGARSNSAAARNYPAFKGELLALVFALTKTEHLLMGRHFLVQTDNDGVAEAKRSPHSVIRNWLVYVGSFDMTIQHIPGKTNIVADALSRLPKESVDADTQEDQASLAALTITAYQEPSNFMEGDGEPCASDFNRWTLARVCSITSTSDVMNVDKAIIANIYGQLLDDQVEDSLIARFYTEYEKLPDNDRVKNYLQGKANWLKAKRLAERNHAHFNEPEPQLPQVNEEAEQGYILDLFSDGAKLMTVDEARKYGLFGRQGEEENALNLYEGIIEEDPIFEIRQIDGVHWIMSGFLAYIEDGNDPLDEEEEDEGSDDDVEEDSNAKVAERLGLPDLNKNTIIEFFHGKHHRGKYTLYTMLKRHFPDLDITQKDVMDFIDECPECQERRTQPSNLGNTRRVPRHRLPVQLEENCIAIDVLSMPVDKHGYKYIMTMVNLLTKFTYAYPMKDKRTESVIEGLLVFSCLYYVPDRVRVDTDSSLTSKDFIEMCRTIGVLTYISLIDRPQSHGTERTNGKLVSYFNKVNKHNKEVESRWSEPDLLYPALSVINSTPNAEIGMTSKEAEWGSTHLLRHSLNPENNVARERSLQITTRVEHCRKIALEVIEKHQEARRRQGRSREVRYQEGDHVFYLPQNMPLNKLRSRVIGPHKVVKQQGSDVHMIDYATGKELRRHIRLCLPAIMPPEQAIAVRMQQVAELNINGVVGFKDSLLDDPRDLRFVLSPPDARNADDHVVHTVAEFTIYPQVRNMMEAIPLFSEFVNGTYDEIFTRYKKLKSNANYKIFTELTQKEFNYKDLVLVSVFHPAFAAHPLELAQKLRENPKWFGIDEDVLSITDHRIFQVYFTGIVTRKTNPNSAKCDIAVNIHTQEKGKCYTIRTMSMAELVHGVILPDKLNLPWYNLDRSAVKHIDFFTLPDPHWEKEKIPGKMRPSQFEKYFIDQYPVGPRIEAYEDDSDDSI